MNKSNQPKLWTFEFSVLCAASLLIYSAQMMLNPTIQMYVKDRLGLGSTEVGLAGTMFTMAALFARPLSGYAVDRWNRRVVLIISTIWFALSMSAHSLVNTFGLLLVMRLLHGLPFSSVTTALNTVATDLVPPARRGEGISVFGFTQALGQAAGPYLAFSALDGLGLHCRPGLSQYVAQLEATRTVYIILQAGLAEMKTGGKPFNGHGWLSP